ncbi:translation initiation factor IF-3 [Candidatus Peribacteria bacterium]|nr:translation initiation factor IF-3 [Candidatus Peribacteria bacterium]
MNKQITADPVRVLLPDGEVLGVMSLQDALWAAKDREVDLVEVSPKADPPVCKLIDVGKLLYAQQKIDKEMKRKTTAAELKGIRLTFRMDVGDMQRQAKHTDDFLSEGHSIKVTLQIKGREMAHKDIALEKMQAFLDALESPYTIDTPPKISGRQGIMILKP